LWLCNQLEIGKKEKQKKKEDKHPHNEKRKRKKRKVFHLPITSKFHPFSF